MDLIYLKENDSGWYKFLRLTLKLLAVALVLFLFYRETYILGLYISQTLFLITLFTIKSLILLLFTTGIKFSPKGKIRICEHHITFMEDDFRNEFSINKLGLIDIREVGKNFWTGSKYYHLSIENYDHEIFKLEPLNKNKIAHLSSLLQTWAPYKLKIRIFNKKGIKSYLV